MREAALTTGGALVAGVDEAGRGALAGGVFAAAVALSPEAPIIGLADSKALSASRRARLADEIRASALAWSVACADEAEIAERNILGASLLAMQRAVSMLEPAPDMVLVDGPHCPTWEPEGARRARFACRAVVGGDRLLACISAASILAKTARDAEMTALARRYPGYGFERHKGYPTRAHRRALAARGPCPAHRLGFAPVRAAYAARQGR